MNAPRKSTPMKHTIKQVEVTRLDPEIVLPTKPSKFSAGYELLLPNVTYFGAHKITSVPMKLKFKIPNFSYATLYDTEACKMCEVTNVHRLLDQTTRGTEIVLHILNPNSLPVTLDKGTPIAQIVFSHLGGWELTDMGVSQE